MVDIGWRWKILLKVGVLLTVLGLLASACGSGEPTKTPAPPTATPTVARATPQATATTAPVASTAVPTVAGATPQATATTAPTAVPTAAPAGAAVVREYSGFKYINAPLTPADWRVAPRRGGTVQVVFGRNFLGRDPTTRWSFVIQAGVSAAYSKLARPLQADEVEVLDPTAVGFKPDLAESWSVNETGTAWTFKLRQGVKWHNLAPGNPNYDERLKDVYGQDVDAEDVATTVNTTLEKGKGALTQWKAAKGAIAVDKYTVRIDMKEPYFHFLGAGPVEIQGWILSKRVLQVDGDWEKHVVGSGPFIVNSWIINQGVKYGRNPNFYRAGVPYVDGIDVTVVTDANLERSGLLTGKFDIVDVGAPGTLLDAKLLAQRGPNIRILETVPVKTSFSLGFHLDQAPYNDIRFRQALALSLNFQEIDDAIFNGAGWVGPVHPWRQVWGEPAKWPKTAAESGQYFRYDVKAARALLDQLKAEGKISKVPFDLPIVAYPYSTAQGEIFRAFDSQLRAGGNFNPQLNLSNDSAFVTKVTVIDRDFQGTAQQFVTITSEDDIFWQETFAPGNKWFITDPELNAAASQQRALRDQADRDKLAQRAWEIVKEKVYMIPTPAGLAYDAISPRLRNYFVLNSGSVKAQNQSAMSIVWLAE